jgi:hypothetical protein
MKSINCVSTGEKIAASADAVWALTPGGAQDVARLDPVSGEIVAHIAAAPQPESMAIGAGAVWVLNQQGTTLTRIDTRTNTVAATLDLRSIRGRRPVAPATTSRSDWAPCGRSRATIRCCASIRTPMP